ncbi:hypothetical protein [Yinghuangia seranimata]|uniref:hypothetical protein n=1 Tax=Yinghuangia seranimata TaxID=408067 RepID=UPI00248D3206|nr:hypothetical protein [Yinghuangia seranimata]MDI2131351.1 hypothetical protein [Yinghuangia seranimata]
MAMAVSAAPAAGAAPSPAAPKPSPVEAAAVASGVCNYPSIELWYDSDQYGSYRKVWFKSTPSCPRGVLITLNATIYCTSPRGTLVYREHATGRTPLELPMRNLPAKAQCKTFHAEATQGIIDNAFLDLWTWNNGNYPA